MKCCYSLAIHPVRSICQVLVSIAWLVSNSVMLAVLCIQCSWQHWVVSLSLFPVYCTRLSKMYLPPVNTKKQFINTLCSLLHTEHMIEQIDLWCVCFTSIKRFDPLRFRYGEFSKPTGIYISVPINNWISFSNLSWNLEKCFCAYRIATIGGSESNFCNEKRNKTIEDQISNSQKAESGNDSFAVSAVQTIFIGKNESSVLKSYYWTYWKLFDESATCKHIVALRATSTESKFQ